MTGQPENQRLPVLVNLTTNDRIELSSPTITLGRDPENQIVLSDDGYASADHARIYWSEGSWWIEDLMSSNGTHVNDKLITEPVELAPQDVIKVGRTMFRIE